MRQPPLARAAREALQVAGLRLDSPAGCRDRAGDRVRERSPGGALPVAQLGSGRLEVDGAGTVEYLDARLRHGVGAAHDDADLAARGWWAVTTEAQLRAWEASWEVPGGSGFVRPALLKDETIAVLAGYDGDRVVAGAIANRSADVTGLSNVFDIAGDLESAWAAGAAAAATLCGGLPTVGYDSGDALAAAHGAGFESIGDLVVWINEPSSSR